MITRWDPAAEPTAPERWHHAPRIVLVDRSATRANTHGAVPLATDAVRGGHVLICSAGHNETPAHPGVVVAAHCRTQADVDQLVPDLRATPAWCRALVLEPRGDLDLTTALWERCVDHRVAKDRDCACEVYENGTRPGWLRLLPGKGVAWVVVLGGDDPLHPAHVRSLRDQAEAAGVPMWLEWGEWVPNDFAPRQVNGYSRRKQAWLGAGAAGPMPEPDGDEDSWWSDGTIRGWGTISIDGTFWDQTTPWTSERGTTEFSMVRVGAARSGHMLDGRDHRDMPACVRERLAR